MSSGPIDHGGERNASDEHAHAYKVNKRSIGERRTLPNVHAKGGNTAPSCSAGVATILDTTASTEEGWRAKEGKRVSVARGGEMVRAGERWLKKRGRSRRGPLSPSPPSSWAGAPAPSPLLNDKR